jgi:hypothetical protein
LFTDCVLVGDISPLDSSIAVSGLQPDHGYVIRILAVNSANFVATSDQISIQTRPADSGDFFTLLPDSQPYPNDDTAGPVVKPYKALFDTPSQSSTPIQKEHSSSHSQQKRQIISRRQTQTGVPTAETVPPISAPSKESEETIRNLTDKLDNLREEKDGLEAQLKTEEDKFRSDQDLLTKQLHDLQQQFQEKGTVSRELGRQVAFLTGQESAVKKSKTAAQDRLNQVLQERERMKDDMLKWASEADDIEETISRLAKEQLENEEKAEQEVKEKRSQITEESVINKTMEESIRQTVVQIRELEEEKKKIDESGVEPDPNQHSSRLGEPDSFTRLSELQHAYAYLTYQLTQARMANQQAQQNLEYWKNLFQANSAQIYPTGGIDLASPRRNSARRRAPSLGSVRNQQLPSYNISSTATFGGMSLASGSANASTNSHFYGLSSGIAHPSSLIAMSPVDVENLTGGAPTSPSAADSLLPSGLFGDDLEYKSGNAKRLRSQSIHESPQVPTSLPGLGAPEALEQMNQGPNSPASMQSRSPSIFTSPRGSTTHLPYPPGTNNFGDSDRRSIRSATGSTRTGSGGGTKFGNLFNLGKAKNKPADDGPEFGSLKASESQSFPQQDLGDQPEPAPSSPRRRVSHSGLGFVGSMLTRANTSASLDQQSSSKRRFNVFGLGKSDPWTDHTDSPRPSSTASGESYGLPLPSAETQSRFGWPISRGEPATHRSSPLGAEWGLAPPPPTSWSAHFHSRNSSSQYPLGLDGTVDELEPSPAQAPIGTRPRSAHVPNTQSTNAPKLNPAAPSFKAIFTRSSTDKKPEKSGKSKKNKSVAKQQQEERQSIESEDHLSTSRLSRDAMSVSTIDYSTDDAAHRDSLDVPGGSSATPSETGGSASQHSHQPRESFMQKLSRKSSAGFTTLAGRKGKNKVAGRDDITTENNAPEDELSRSVISVATSTDDKGAPSPSLSAAARGFKFRSLRRRKADKQADAEAEEPVDCEVGVEEGRSSGREKEKDK